MLYESRKENRASKEGEEEGEEGEGEEGEEEGEEGEEEGEEKYEVIDELEDGENDDEVVKQKHDDSLSLRAELEVYNMYTVHFMYNQLFSMHISTYTSVTVHVYMTYQCIDVLSLSIAG